MSSKHQYFYVAKGLIDANVIHSLYPCNEKRNEEAVWPTLYRICATSDAQNADHE